MAETLTLAPKSTALVVIDLQEGIVTLSTEPHAASEVVARAARVAEAMRRAGGFAVLVHVGPSPDGKDALRPLADRPRKMGAKLPPNWDRIVSVLGPEEGDHVVRKRQWGAFYGTDLDLELRRRRIDTILLCGIASNMGVESTARDAYERGYNMIFLEDAISAVRADLHAFAVEEIFPLIGRVRSTAEVISALSSASPAGEA